MKTQLSLIRTFCIFSSALFIISCNKNDLSSSNDSLASSNTIAVATSTSTTAAEADSVYLVQPCKHGERRDSISQLQLPASISNYLSANYANAVFAKAFVLKNNSSAITGYVVVIYYNSKPVGLQFDSSQRYPGTNLFGVLEGEVSGV